MIRVDPIGGATDTRRLPVDASGTSLYWVGLNKAKKSVEVDLKTAEGRAIVTSLIAAPGPGIVVTNSVGQGWLSYDELRKHRSDLIHVHILGRSDGKPAVDQAGRQFAYHVATLMGKGEGTLEASMVKAYVCKAAEWVSREAMQIHGGFGYAEEYTVSRLFVDARVLSIFEGADETLCLKVIARRLIEASSNN